MGVKKYFGREFQKDKWFLEHENAADFYLCSWQRNRSTVPLLLLRTLIFGGCVSIWVTSQIMTARAFSVALWYIFLTHWGLIFNTVASGMALAVSLRAFIKGPIDGTLSLPWYVKVYWVCYNTAIPIAFFITLFYWTLLIPFSDGIAGEGYAIDPVLDVFIHGINSVLMLALALVARHPTRLLHFYWPICISLIYLVFTVIFHFSGALSPFGTSWVYPMLDWDSPGTTIAVVIGSAICILIIHCILAGITVARDKLTRRFRESNTLAVSGDERYR